MTRDEMIESVQFAREWAEAQVAEAKDHGALMSVFELDKVLAALRATPDLVAAPTSDLVGQWRRHADGIRSDASYGYGGAETWAKADQLDQCADDLAAALVEPPARPETATPTPAEDDGKSTRDHAPRYSQVDMDMATKPLHAEIERLRAAATPAPTRELLGRVDFFLDQCDSSKGHEAAEFWLGRAYGIIRDVRAALSSPVGETPEGK